MANALQKRRAEFAYHQIMVPLLVTKNYYRTFQSIDEYFMHLPFDLNQTLLTNFKTSETWKILSSLEILIRLR